MKERLVRGTNVANVVRVLRSYHGDRPLPELGHWEQDLLRKRVSRSTWYSLAVFDSLLQVVHRYVYDGSEAAARSMGRTFARELLKADPEGVVAGNPEASLSRMHVRWREHFNFGDIKVTPQSEPGHHVVRVQLTGYPDMSACHGQSIVGWSLELAELAGAPHPAVRIEERPWMHNSALTYTLQWEG